eukprot:scaffold73455_cov67-Phaeocystis_antarctica.AAC.8
MPRPQRTGAAQDRCPLCLRELCARAGMLAHCWILGGMRAVGTRRLRFDVMPGGDGIFKDRAALSKLALSDAALLDCGGPVH